jgi:type 1 glutamine amidotransferase
VPHGSRIIRLTLMLTLGAFAALSCVVATRPREDARLLVFSKTEGFRHTSIAAGVAAIQAIGASNGFIVEHTENAAIFNAASLQHFNAVVFLNTTGDVLDSAQQVAFENFVKAGGGFAGVHSATDTEYDWPWYGGLVGAYFKSHPAIQSATVTAATLAHPATSWMSGAVTRTDEWYDFLALPTGVSVLLTVDEATYTGGTMGDNHPIAWYHLYDGGRAFYTAMGHTDESYGEPAFLQHLTGGLLWAMGL